ncbi:MAG TPA: nuclear transport factor 2 family protein [Polyangiaceae bacterium]|nr:nuclear transport factor 2 family protein [Polyangiaceae bacterium]
MTHQATAKQVIEGAADELALRRVHDRAAIEELLIRYTMSVDLRDWVPFRSCFADRVRVRFDPPLAEAPEEPIAPEEWAPFAGSFLASTRDSQHYYSIYPIRLDDDEAEAVMYYRAGAGEHVDEPPFLHSTYSTFRCRRTRDGWKIAEISTHSLDEAIERGPQLDASYDLLEEPASETRPRSRARKPAKKQEAKRGQRSAAKRR